MLYYNQYVRAESLEEAYDLYRSALAHMFPYVIWRQMKH